MTTLKAAMLYRLGTLSADWNDNQEAMRRWQQASTLFEEAGDRHGKALVDFLTAILYRHQGRNDLALELVSRAVVALRETGDHGAEAFALRSIAQVHLADGNYPDADVYLDRALELARKHKARRREAQALFYQGMLRIKQHRYDDAQALFKEVHALARSLGDRSGQIQAQRGLGLCHEGRGDPELAVATLREALKLARQPTPTLLERRVLEDLTRLTTHGSAV